ncbi:MAG TPA: thioesterase [Paludibacteraceae bacterium]|nr:thioesterase [Paludibacteraceae bacterium]
MEKEFSYIFKIAPSNVDFQGKLTLASLIELLMEVAGRHADGNGFGMRQLNEFNASWVVLRIALEINYYPEQYDEIKISTWIEKIQPIKTIRNFCIENAQGEIIASATSEWIMMDLTQRKPKDLLSLEGFEEFATGKEIPAGKLEKLPPVKGELVDKITVKYGDIDINEHVNSIRYVQWLCNCFNLSDYREKQIERFEIHYISELHENEIIKIFREEKKKNDFYFEIDSDKKTTCKARISFSEK